MPGHAGAYHPVSRRGGTAARVAGDHARDALHVLEHGVHAPEASSREHGDLLTLGGWDPGRGRERRDLRSEEHTSELQSRLHLVCRLLLEKKKKHQRSHASDHYNTL